MWVYVDFAKNKTVRKYLLVVLFLALGLMAKPMLVILPFGLLLMNFWPLKRLKFWDTQEGARTIKAETMFYLIREKSLFLF